MAVEAKYLICEGAHEALEELDNMNLSSTKSKETNIYIYPVFERLMKENSCRLIKKLLKTTVIITKSK